MAGKIFISYRRSDTAWAARALFERLWRTFPEQIFIDLEGISPGAEFTQVIDSHLEGCHAMLAMIGPTWLEQIQDRIEHGEEDFVRLELARALQRNIPVVPVLLDGATVPRARDLPDDLKAVTRRNAVAVIIDTFDGQVPRIEREVRLILQAAGVTVIPEVQPALAFASAPATTAPPASPVFAVPVASLPSSPPAAPAIIASAPAPDASRPAWMHEHGEDAHGRWADLRIHRVTQRLRWIEPGQFSMGSRAPERERFLAGEKDKTLLDDEAPNQAVIFTKGFWLADTACTQALWQTLVGSNPSHFTGSPQLPVEQVSWHDVVQIFLPALNARLEGVEAVLPTEAQWEYACRAGTKTAYCFGDRTTPEKVNFNGNFPPPGAKKGLFREQTVPVKALPTNAWGLYQMHGNVWEWCADWKGPYLPKILKDAEGPSAGTERVLRGGSWSSFARHCRAADRGNCDPTVRGDGIGFRLALRAA